MYMMSIVMVGDYAFFFVRYRVLSFYFYIILVSVFASVKIESMSVPQFADRNFATFERDFGLFCFVWTWFAGIVSHCSGIWILKGRGTSKMVNREDIMDYCAKGQFKDAAQLVLFGVKQSNDDKGNVK